jgi:large subunit ribosomal protein L25
MKKTLTEKKKMVLGALIRTVFGKKNKKLRKTGLLPANIYGTNFPSQAISINYVEFKRMFRVVGETGVVYIKTEKDEIPTLVTSLQRDPIEGLILHADFRKVDLSIKIEAVVPLTFIGIAPAVNAGGVILTQTDKVTVEALPQDIPNHIEINLSTLVEIGNEIKVGDIVVNPAYTIKTEPEKVIISVAAHKEESVVAETTAAATPEVLTAKQEVTADGEPAKTSPAEEKKEEKKEAKKE